MDGNLKISGNTITNTKSGRDNSLAMTVGVSTLKLGDYGAAADNFTLQVKNIAAANIVVTKVDQQTATGLDIQGADASKLAVGATGKAVYTAPTSSNIKATYGVGADHAVSSEARDELARQGDIFAEVSRAKSAEGSLTSRVSVEESRAASAEGSLTSRVSVEESRAKSAEGSLTTNVSNSVSTEQSRAISAEGSLTSRVSVEESRAASAEGSLTSRVSVEESRAKSAEGSLTSNVSNSVSTEQSRAVSAEGSLTSRVSSEESRAAVAEENLLKYINNFMGGTNIATALKVTGEVTGSAFNTASLTAGTVAASAATIALLVSNNSTGYSDARLKKDVEDVLDATAKVNALHPVFYNWNDRASLNPGMKEIGFIAQELEAVLPHVVRTLDDEMGTKTVAYDRLVSLLVAALKEHDVRITALENK